MNFLKQNWKILCGFLSFLVACIVLIACSWHVDSVEVKKPDGTEIRIDNATIKSKKTTQLDVEVEKVK